MALGHLTENRRFILKQMTTGKALCQNYTTSTPHIFHGGWTRGFVFTSNIETGFSRKPLSDFDPLEPDDQWTWALLPSEQWLQPKLSACELATRVLCLSLKRGQRCLFRVDQTWKDRERERKGERERKTERVRDDTMLS